MITYLPYRDKCIQLAAYVSHTSNVWELIHLIADDANVVVNYLNNVDKAEQIASAINSSTRFHMSDGHGEFQLSLGSLRKDVI